MGCLDGSVAIVTGAAGQRGIGRAVAVAMAREGADVVVTDIGRRSLTAAVESDDWRGLDGVVDEIEAIGRSALAITADVSSESDVARVISETLRVMGRIDILVNNAAAPQERGSSGGWDISEEEWRRTVDITLTGQFLMCRHAIPHMLESEGRGRIINMSSIAGKIGLPIRPAYCASKHGVLGLTKSFALDVAARGMTVNAICPGLIDTDRGHGRRDPSRRLTRTGRSVTREEYIKEQVPAGHAGSPDDVAGLAVFLASPAGRYITGQAINVDGGWVM
jgi:meso-butanediol dehydrogenase / (S,S)-butanediol dehydrogenase / diacetyl reductase